VLVVGLVLGICRVVSLEDRAKHLVMPFSVTQWISLADFIILIGPWDSELFGLGMPRRGGKYSGVFIEILSGVAGVSYDLLRVRLSFPFGVVLLSFSHSSTECSF